MRDGAPPDARAEALVLKWARTYTRGVRSSTAERRLAELESDCHEQRAWGREVGAAPTAVAASMAARTLAGVPADLLWRHTHLAVSRDQPLLSKGVMMTRLRQTWWLVLGGLGALLVITMGVSSPLEERTAGSVAGGIVIGLLGVAGLVGQWVRRRHRVGGDLMIAAGVLPMIPFVWAVIPPIGALAVIVAATFDVADALAVGADRRGDRAERDKATAALVATLITAVIAAVVIGDAATAILMVTPVTALLVSHTVYRRRLPAAPMIRSGLTLLTAGLITGLGAIGTVAYEDNYFEGNAAVGTAVGMVAGAGLLIGAALILVGAWRGRDKARPA